MTYDKVYRSRKLPGFHGRLCRITMPAPVRRVARVALINVGTETVEIEFMGGEKHFVPKQAICDARSKQGRQVIAKAAPGWKRRPWTPSKGQDEWAA